MSAPPSVELLRAAVDEHLRKNDTYAQLRQLIREYATNGAGGSSAPAATNERAALAQLVAAVERAPAPELVNGLEGDGLPIGTPTLVLRLEVKGGEAFAGEVSDLRTTGEINMLRLHVLFRRQRAASPPTPSALDPALSGAFLFELSRPPPSSEREWHTLLEEEDGLIRFALTRERTGPGPPLRTLVATAAVDWRHALLLRGSVLPVQLRPSGPDSVLSAAAPGMLKISLDIAPLPATAPVPAPTPPADASAAGADAAGDAESGAKADAKIAESSIAPPFDEATIRQPMQRFTATLGESARDFYLHARKWWNEFTSISPQCASRPVRLFARDEAGETRCVCAFVSPLRAGRSLDSPRHAARFVALLPLERASSVGGARAEAWACPFAFVARRVGDVWEHACLLCSLLLGFGLNAFVAVGTIADGRGGEQEHAWVITCSGGPADPAGGNELRVSAWESISGQRCVLAPIPEAPAAQRYVSIACVFSHRRFHANRQSSDRFPGVSLDFSNQQSWKSIDEGVLQKLRCASAAADFALTSTRLDSAATEAALEAELRAQITTHRRNNLGVETVWDEQVGHASSVPLPLCLLRTSMYPVLEETIGVVHPQHQL